MEITLPYAITILSKIIKLGLKHPVDNLQIKFPVIS